MKKLQYQIVSILLCICITIGIIPMNAITVYAQPDNQITENNYNLSQNKEIANDNDLAKDLKWISDQESLDRTKQYSGQVDIKQVMQATNYNSKNATNAQYEAAKTHIINYINLGWYHEEIMLSEYYLTSAQLSRMLNEIFYENPELNFLSRNYIYWTLDAGVDYVVMLRLFVLDGLDSNNMPFASST